LRLLCRRGFFSRPRHCALNAEILQLARADRIGRGRFCRSIGILGERRHRAERKSGPKKYNAQAQSRSH
jgi:hypothetical protein